MQGPIFPPPHPPHSLAVGVRGGAPRGVCLSEGAPVLQRRDDEAGEVLAEGHVQEGDDEEVEEHREEPVGVDLGGVVPPGEVAVRVALPPRDDVRDGVEEPQDEHEGDPEGEVEDDGGQHLYREGDGLPDHVVETHLDDHEDHGDPQDDQELDAHQ
eukprot:CAMPEP_0175695476 /NCGR_PEP_ID=MMETSP0097-20121207/32459_1 /TAXON_ID=311494 /ORGANISM="Alexandrium monilatum, Strain CCMP3105" /LENGTH=155 /DNA_ID=CAMNT_0017002611 /DNA_START=1 /DNA_END=465 /DNA_ORIENTATION=+